MLKLSLSGARTEQRFRPFTRRLLFVDDDREDLLRYSTILKIQGYNVRTCASYSEALDCLDQETFDLVMVSQGGPRFEGRPVLARALEKDRNTPVLVLAPAIEMLCCLEAMQLGAVEYVQKPLTFREIARLAAKYVEHRPEAAG